MLPLSVYVTGATAAVKFTPPTFVLLMVTAWVEGLNVKPTLLGVTA
jgi:hypothetical protein